MASAVSAGATRPSQRSAVLHCGGACAQRCALCDCAWTPSSKADITRALDGGGARLLLRGTPENSPTVSEIIGRAREQGYAEVVVHTNAVDCRTPEGVAAFKRIGADGVMVPLFSQIPAVHDQIAGRQFALVHSLAGMKALAKAGMSIEIEVPLIAPRLQNLVALVEQAHKVVPMLRGVRFFVPSFEVPPLLAPPRWSVAAPLLARALTRCKEFGIKVALTAAEGVPLCALRDYPDLLDLYRFNPRATSSTWGGSSLEKACATCAVAPQCPGVAPAYRKIHGDTDLVPYPQRPSLMYEQRTTRRREWNAEQRKAASQADLLVLRPTVNCNQDCTFCSANETSNNVWSEPDVMIRAIARAARRGLRRMSFSGGEPTLSRDLVRYIRAASRLGVQEIELVTNGALLDSEKRVAPLVAAGLSRAYVSLHGHDERLAREATQKIGDFARTVTAIKLLLDAGVTTALNHVITARNYPYMKEFVEFVRREFGGRVKIAFSFVTPQFKALDNLEVMPRIAEVMPYLKRAMYRALELGQPFSVGSRQGIPYCYLGEFQAWSDGLGLTHAAISEDTPQKQKGPMCEGCRYTRYCTGLWRPYVAKYGFEELKAIPGNQLTDEDVAAIRAVPLPLPWGVPLSFADVPEAVRDRAGETGPPDLAALQVAVAAPVHLPMFVPLRTRPIRLALLGTGKQARRLARHAIHVPSLSIDAVISPHALQSDLRDFGSCPAYTDPLEAIEGIRPEGMIIATRTEAHLQLARLAMERGIPALVERPLTRLDEEAEELVREATEQRAVLLPAHSALHAAGIDAVLGPIDGQVQVSVVRRRLPSSEDTCRTWSRIAVYDAIYDAIVVAGRSCGGGAAEVLKVQFRGDSVPERFRIELRYLGGTAELVLDYAGSVEEDAVVRSGATGDPSSETTWRRLGRDVSVTSAAGVTAIEPQGTDIQRMLAHFRDVVLGKAEPRDTLAEALDVMRNSRRVLDAIAAAGAPFDRKNAPKHVASRELRQPLR